MEKEEEPLADIGDWNKKDQMQAIDIRNEGRVNNGIVVKGEEKDEEQGRKRERKECGL